MSTLSPSLSNRLRSTSGSLSHAEPKTTPNAIGISGVLPSLTRRVSDTPQTIGALSFKVNDLVIAPIYSLDGHLSGSAWTFDEGSGEYYLHLYVEKQPDLNWDNPTVRNAVWDVMRFWLDRGCDGFRMDVINIISKTDGLPDAPIVDPNEEFQPASMYFANGPRVHDYIREMREKVLDRTFTIL